MTYRLRREKLEEYLRSLFPNHQGFNVQVREPAARAPPPSQGYGARGTTLACSRANMFVSAQLSEDGEDSWTFDIPNRLSNVRRKNHSFPVADRRAYHPACLLGAKKAHSGKGPRQPTAG